MLNFKRSLWAVSSLALLVGSAAGESAICLKHDDGTQEGKRSMTGSGHAVHFECPDGEKWYISAVSVHGSRYGTPQTPDDDFRLVIASDDLTRRREIKKPYSLFKRGQEEWVKFDIEPVEVQGAFHVAVFFDPTRSKGIYVGIDTHGAATHSATILATDPGKKQSDLQGDWMIRAYLTKEVDGPAQLLQDELGLAQQRTEEAAARDADILGQARSLTLKHDAGPMDDHMNIQGALYTVGFDTPQGVEGYVWQVQVHASQFGGRHDSQAVSGDVYILDANRRVITRTTFPYSVATQQKQWIEISTLPTKVQGKFFVSVDSHGTRYKGLYMGYREGNKDRFASTDELQDGHVRPADWSKKFEHMQWMIRAKIADRPVVY